MLTAKATASEFIDALYPDGWLEGHYVERRVFKGGRPAQEFCASAEELLGATVPEDRDVYFGACLRRGQSGNEGAVSHVPAAYGDVDLKRFGGNSRLAVEAIKQFPLPPSFVVFTGGGFHPYWLLAELFEIENFEDRSYCRNVMRGLQSTISSDPVHDLGRILRWPGSRNQKYPHKPLVEIVSFHPQRRYNVSEIEDATPEWARHDTEKQGEARLDIADCLANIHNGDRNNSLFKIAGKLRHYGCSSGDIYALLEPHAERVAFPLEELQKLSYGVERYSPATRASVDVLSAKAKRLSRAFGVKP